ncbi:MAG TPA: EAL domain-containing protein [Rhodocyclaceae bacterium]|nr:EAL domain-containing protein [Rhodocyclaceae bacterium]
MELGKLFAYFEEWRGRQSVQDHALLFDDSGAVGCYDGLRLYSVFQPILQAGNLKAAAYEALLRVRDLAGAPVGPQDVFKRTEVSEEILYLDRLCRVIHSVNFFSQGPDRDLSLFLNVDGRHLLNVGGGGHGRTFLALLVHCEVRPQQVVLEIVESLVADSRHLVEAIESYQRLGYRIAIDDFGSRESNFDRLWNLSPDIVKLDRSLVLQSVVNARARRVLPKLVEIIHELGATVVCEGIENEDQHLSAVDAGADLLQGYYYARPAAQIGEPDLAFLRQPAAQPLAAEVRALYREAA